VSLGAFQLEPGTRRLFRKDGTEIHLSQKPFQVLMHLVENRHRLVTRAELITRFWDDREVYDQALTRCLSSIRKALDDQADPPRYIETRWAEGYRYIGPFTELASAAAPITAEAAAPAGSTAKKPCPFCRAMAALAVLAIAVAATIVYRATRDDGTDGADIRRIAVLPLRAGADVEPWMADGLSDRLINALSHIDGLTVIARGSTQDLSSAAPDAGELGRTLGVQAFISGSVTLSEDALHLAARLTSTADGSVLWTFDTQHPRTDPMRAEREVTLALASHLSARLRTALVQTRDESAYRHYLRARHLMRQRTEASLTQAIEHFDAAIAADPNYADAHSCKAEALLLLPLYAGAPPQDVRPRARAAAEAALRLDPQHGRAHLVLAVITQFDWNWAEADAHYDRAVALNPSDASAVQWRAEAQCFRRRFEACRAGLAVARELNPLSPIIAVIEGTARRWSGDHAGALQAYRAVQKRSPGFAFVNSELGQLYSAQGRWEEAIASFRAAEPAFDLSLVGGPLAYAYARSGRRAEALRLKNDMLAYQRAHYLSPVSLAIVELGLGNTDGALDLLERAVDERDEHVIFLAVGEHYRELEGHPRFRALLSRTGLRP
jgi:serine/threonine-protein kinase